MKKSKMASLLSKNIKDLKEQFSESSLWKCIFLVQQNQLPLSFSCGILLVNYVQYQSSERSLCLEFKPNTFKFSLVIFLKRRFLTVINNDWIFYKRSFTSAFNFIQPKFVYLSILLFIYQKTYQLYCFQFISQRILQFNSNTTNKWFLDLFTIIQLQSSNPLTEKNIIAFQVYFTNFPLASIEPSIIHFKCNLSITTLQVATLRSNHSFSSNNLHILSALLSLEYDNPSIINKMSFPIINLASHFSNKMPTKHLALQIRSICKQTGFFAVENHGVSQILQKSIIQNTNTFFELPKEAKKQARTMFGERGSHGYFGLGDQVTSGKVDLKEGIWLGKELFQTQLSVARAEEYEKIKQFFNQVPELKKDVIQYFKRMEQLGTLLISAVSYSLDLQPDYFRKTVCKDSLGLLGLMHYPYYQHYDLQNDWGVGEHTDYGLLTILMMTEEGLQIKNLNNEWVKISPKPNTFVINIGDVLQKMTRGLYKSTPHRVRNTAKRSRYSFPYFYDPGWKAEIKELDIKVTPQEMAIFQKNRNYKRWDKTNLQTISGTYGEYQINKIKTALPKWQSGSVEL